MTSDVSYSISSQPARIWRAKGLLRLSGSILQSQPNQTYSAKITFVIFVSSKTDISHSSRTRHRGLNMRLCPLFIAKWRSSGKNNHEWLHSMVNKSCFHFQLIFNYFTLLKTLLKQKVFLLFLKYLYWRNIY